MTPEKIKQLHDLEAERQNLEQQREQLKAVLKSDIEHLSIEISAMGWHSASTILRLHSMPQEILDALSKVLDRVNSELINVNKQIDEL